MSAGTIVLLVFGILAFQACIWIPIILVRKKKVNAQSSALDLELLALAQNGERTILPPTRARVRRGHVSGHATVALTNQRMIVLARSRNDIAVADILDARHASSFNSEIFMGARFVIVKVKGNEVGFGVLEQDAPRWVDAIKKCVADHASATAS